MRRKKKIIYISLALLFFVLLYCFAEGVTEGYTWASNLRRSTNILVSGSLGEGKAILDYHTYRNLELVGIVGATISALFLFVSLKKFLLLLIGSFAFGFGILYERALQYVDKGVLFEPNPPKYDILRFSFQSSNAIEIIVGLIGILLIIWYFVLIKKRQ